MDPHKKDLSKKPDQLNHLQEIPRLVHDNQRLEDKYLQVSSELHLLKKRIQILKHDLLNPLGGISGMADLMIIKGKGQIEVQTCDLITIKEAAQSLQDLINNAIVNEDAQKNHRESGNTYRNLSSVISKINRLYLPMAQNKGISMLLRSLIDTEIQLSPGFFNNLIHITGNLVANAVKFTPSNGSVDVVFALNTDKSRTTLNITVSDTGKSMSPDQVSAFNRGKSVTRTIGTNGEQGFGIGLQHTLHLVSEYAGSIVVKNGKDSGTTFSLSFPIPDNNLLQMNGSSSFFKKMAQR